MESNKRRTVCVDAPQEALLEAKIIELEMTETAPEDSKMRFCVMN